MQRYERYALVALMFLVSTVAVVALWDDGTAENDVLAMTRDSNDPASGGPVEMIDEEALAQQEREDRRLANLRRAQERLRQEDAQVAEGRAGAAQDLAISGQDELLPDVNRVTTRSAGVSHRSRPEAPAPGELEGLVRPTQVAKSEPVSLTSRRQVATSTARNAGRLEREVPRSVEQPVKKALAPEVEPKASVRTYTVKSGDALERIASRELGSRDLAPAIASLNGITNPDKIFVGMVLSLPDSASTSPATPKVAAAAEAPSPRNESSVPGAGLEYTIRKGEPLSLALTRELGTYKRSIALVKALNPGLNPDRVREGQVILLPRLEDIPAAPDSGSRSKPQDSAAPSLEGSTAGSRVAAAIPTADRSTARADSEFVVR